MRNNGKRSLKKMVFILAVGFYGFFSVLCKKKSQAGMNGPSHLNYTLPVTTMATFGLAPRFFFSSGIFSI